MPVSKETLDEIALTEAEYQLIVDKLDREPNPLELGMFGALWSEHCGYKHSRPLLKLLPSTGPRTLTKQGEQNAGAVDIGNGLAVVFKIESHNHPSAVEPLQGAATGVGGIVRDILAMGARPIALMNTLRFGPLDDPRNRYLFEGVVEGISWYGNCIGVPDVGGEIYFSSVYSGNPLVNALCVGLVEKDKLISATTGREGNVLLLVGADTGRDGIHGASGLASRAFEDEREMRPTVQVGNPFLEKVLIEACLEAAASGMLEGMQDLGAAGLTSASIESASKSKGGIELDLSQVHRREAGMNPYEVMLSESQERMLLAVRPEHAEHIRKIFEKWDVDCVEIGRAMPSRRALISDDGEIAAQLPIDVLTEAPKYRLKGARSDESLRLVRYPLGSVPLPKESPEDVLLGLLNSHNVCSRENVYRQYDNQVQTNTVLAPGGDAALLRIKGTSTGLALATDGNGRYCFLDPYKGGAIAVAEACRNVSCTGATPIALTDCLNFGSPDNPDVYYQLEWAVRGMAAACRILDTPVVSGNVSLYNDTRGQPIYPTPIVGALGLLEDISKRCSSAFIESGDTVALLGVSNIRGKASHLAGSEYLESVHGLVAGRPNINLELERSVQKLCRDAIGSGLIRSAHDCSDGGLAVALAECCIQGGLGFTGTAKVLGRWDAALFGEAQSRIVVSLKPEDLPALEQLASESNVPMTVLGRTSSDSGFTIPGLIDSHVDRLREAWTDKI